jgi:flagellar basal-body rod protein FlgG
MYSAAAGMAAQQQRMDAAANDLANTNTTGYKHVRVAFRDLAYTASGTGGTRDVLIGGGAGATLIGRSLQQGALQQTQAPLDVALQGQGFIAVPAGTPEGDIHVGADGTVTAGTTRLGAIRIVTVPNPSALQGGPDNTFRATAASGAAAAAPRTTVLTQGALEGSNVDLGEAMVDLMDAQRGFELASKAIQYQDQLMEIANGIKR